MTGAQSKYGHLKAGHGNSGVLAGGAGGQLPPPLRVKYEGRQNGNPKHMGAEGALFAVLVK